MYNHKEDDLWKAIGLEEKEVVGKLETITKKCIDKELLPSEKIELMATKLKRVELAAIVMMLEYRVRNLSTADIIDYKVGYA